jgi:hypothetical protein
MGVNRTELRRLAGLALLAASVSVAVTSSADTQAAGATSTKKPAHHTIHHSKARKAKVRGQKAIDEDRARQIQQALIREHYLKGEPTGKWDLATQQAMQHYQADQGWQSKNVPDSRALIRLGLGPDNQHLLNPESAMTTVPAKRGPSSTGGAAAAQASTPASGAMTTNSAVSAPSSQVAVPPAR